MIQQQQQQRGVLAAAGTAQQQGRAAAAATGVHAEHAELDARDGRQQPARTRTPTKGRPSSDASKSGTVSTLGSRGSSLRQRSSTRRSSRRRRAPSSPSGIHRQAAAGGNGIPSGPAQQAAAAPGLSACAGGGARGGASAVPVAEGRPHSNAQPVAPASATSQEQARQWLLERQYQESLQRGFVAPVDLGRPATSQHPQQVVDPSLPRPGVPPLGEAGAAAMAAAAAAELASSVALVPTAGRRRSYSRSGDTRGRLSGRAIGAFDEAMWAAV